MWIKLGLIVDFISNMGWRYIAFRIWHVIQIKTGVFKKKFPVNPEFKRFISLEDWRAAHIPFFINSKETLHIPPRLNDVLESRFHESVNNNITFFNSQQIQLEKETQWFQNPSTGHCYDMNKHWSQIADLSKEAGDIKFVWEKARFSFIYDIIRYDYHSQQDQSDYVLGEIENFIDHNGINLGPQYKCSQEISLRILNWTYAIHYYKNSSNLTPALFDKMINSIYWQLDHVRKNIHFSRIAVRNNHAITETLMLYLSRLLFPFIPETVSWSKVGKKWFEQEIDYQIYEDGTFLQYSMNYHRVVVQLLTWGIKLSEFNDEELAPAVYLKAKRSLEFLDASLEERSGKLPNYGSNDGALFFKFTDLDYRNYTSQLDDLRMVLSQEAVMDSESFAWYGMNTPKIISRPQKEIAQFKNGGYYIINETGQDHSKTFIRCGSYKDRPAQADNLHLDIWINGENYLWDNGSYKYNTEDSLLKHFMGTSGHNTVSVNDKDQMLKGGRFIWYKWIKSASAKMIDKGEQYNFSGSIDAFRHLGGITHHRDVVKEKSILKWQVMDHLNNNSGLELKQHWHINPKVHDKVEITATDEKGNLLVAHKEEKWHSSYYGLKEKSIAITFTTFGTTFNTIIEIKDS